MAQVFPRICRPPVPCGVRKKMGDISSEDGPDPVGSGDTVFETLQAVSKADLMAETRRYLAAASVVLVAIFVVISFLQAYPLPAVRDDAVEYLALARNLASGNGFTMDGSIPAVYRPPLFSALLGGWFFLTGTSSVASAAIFQSLVHAAGVLAAFFLFLELTPSLAWATFAALFLAVNPLLVTRVVFVLQEPTLLLFTTLAAYLSVRMVKTPSTPRAALTGAAWGLCTLAKVVAGFIPFVLLAMHFLPGRLRREWKCREAAALLLCFVAIVAPWTARNYVYFHRFIPVNDEGAGVLAWAVSHARIQGEPTGEAYLKKIDSGGFSPDARKELMWKYIRDHPRYFLVNRIAKNVVHFAAPSRDWWIVTGRAAIGEHGHAYFVLAALFHVPLYLFFLLRIGQWLRGRASTALGFLVLLYWTYWAQHAILWGDPRYGLAVYPVLVSMVLPWTGTSGDERLGRTPAADKHRAGELPQQGGLLQDAASHADGADEPLGGRGVEPVERGDFDIGESRVPQRFRQAPADEGGLIRRYVPHPSPQDGYPALGVNLRV